MYQQIIQGGVGAIMETIGAIKGAKEQKRVAEILRNLPGYEPVDVGLVAKEAISANQANLPAATSLASTASQSDQEILMKQLKAAIPKYSQIMESGGTAITNQLQGKLSPETVAAISRASAGRFVGQPTMASASSARQLGLTTEDIVNRGVSNAMGWLQTAKSVSLAPTMSVSSMFVSPNTAIQVAMENAQNNYVSAMNQAMGRTAGGGDAFWAQYLQKKGGELQSGAGMGGGGMGGMDFGSMFGGAAGGAAG